MANPPIEYTGKTATFRRYSNLSAKIIPLGDGENPPAHVINPDYKQQPGNTRKCIECGKLHDCIVENMMTGERLEEIGR